MLEYGRIGMVLSGGGAKGAYQMGVFNALEELGLLDRVAAVSGSSIGALNALLLASDSRVIRRFTWVLLSRVLGNAGAKKSPEAKKRARSIDLDDLFGRLTGLAKVRSTRIKLYACAYNIDEGRPEYFMLNGMSPEDMATVCAASCSLPGTLPSVEYNGARYCDGGAVPEGSKEDNADKIPTAPLKALDCDMVIISYLIASDQADISGFRPGTKIVELRPSRPLESSPGAGTLNFAPDVTRRHRELGYADTMVRFAAGV